jgi:carboxyl-terminal processing protease
VRDLDLDAPTRITSPAPRADSRWDFDHLTRIPSPAQNGHTDFRDAFLDRAGGSHVGFIAVLEGKWTIVETFTDKLKTGDVIERIGGTPVNGSFRKTQVHRRVERGRRAGGLLQPESSLPAAVSSPTAGGAAVSIDRSTHELRFPERRGAEARWIEPSIATSESPFEEPKFEDFALNAVKEYRNAQAIVFDVRGNGGGATPTRLLRALMDRPYRDWSQASALSIGLFRAHARVQEIARPGEISERETGYLDAFTEFAAPQLVAPGGLIRPENPIYLGKIVVLTDFTCASACEDFAMPLKYSGRALIAGERTRGSSGQPFIYDFGNGMRFRIGSRRMYFPDGAEFEGVGIAPNVEVRPTIADRRNGKDVVLERALQMASGR